MGTDDDGMKRISTASGLADALTSDQLQRVIDWLSSAGDTCGNGLLAAPKDSACVESSAVRLAWELYWALHLEEVYLLSPQRALMDNHDQERNNLIHNVAIPEESEVHEA